MTNVIARPDGRDWMELPPDGTDCAAAAARPAGGMRLAYSLVHMPAISAFCGTSESGLPVGLQIAGPKFSDATLLALGARVLPQEA